MDGWVSGCAWLGYGWLIQDYLAGAALELVVADD